VKTYSCVEVYIERKRATGLIYRASAKLLWRFAHFVGNVDIASITEHQLEQFLSRNALSNNTWRRYVSYLSRFFVYWFARRQLKHIPKATQKPATKTAFFPFVYSRSEIRRLMDAIPACVRYPRCAMDAETLRTILLLVYGTGMRIGLVLGLSHSNVDLERKTIHIQSEYPQLSRDIPIGSDVACLLRRYLEDSRRATFGSDRALFLTVKGEPVRYAVVGHAFQQLRKLTGVSRLNSYYQPRIHDLRHSFAVHSIANWRNEDLSLEKMLPMLAAYMGNVNLEGFERYLELAPSSFQNQLGKLKISRSQ
jgi:integrase/recombinase XerD